MSNIKHGPIHESSTSSNHPSTGTTTSGKGAPVGTSATGNNKNANLNLHGGLVGVPLVIPPDDRLDADQSRPLGPGNDDDGEGPHPPEGGPDAESNEIIRDMDVENSEPVGGG